MATTEAGDGSEHVTDFLRRIKELGEQRDQEDTERTRKLEEEIAEARRQREERRRGIGLFHFACRTHGTDYFTQSARDRCRQRSSLPH